MDTPQVSSSEPYDLVLEVMVEGGSLRLLATRTVTPVYAAFLNGQTLAYVDEGPVAHRRSQWGSWALALKALDRYPWRTLRPVFVESHHASRIWPLLESSWQLLDEGRRRQWAELCGQSADAPDFDTGPLKRGDRVVHPGMPEWGVGSVLEDSDGTNVHAFFELGGERGLSLQYAKLRRVAGDQARSLILDNLKMDKGKPSANYRSVPASIAFFLQEFPGGFEGERLRFHERDHKRRIHAEALEQLGAGVFKELLAAGNHAEICTRAQRLTGSQQNAMIFSHEKMALRNGLQTPEAQKLFAERLLDVLHGEGDFGSRFDAWAACLEQIGAAKWPIATYFLFFMHPDRHMFVKPTITQYAAEICAFDVNYRSEVNSKTYMAVMQFAAYLKDAIAEIEPADMIDVQSFMWCIAPGTYTDEDR